MACHSALRLNLWVCPRFTGGLVIDNWQHAPSSVVDTNHVVALVSEVIRGAHRRPRCLRAALPMSGCGLLRRCHHHDQPGTLRNHACGAAPPAIFRGAGSALGLFTLGKWSIKLYNRRVCRRRQTVDHQYKAPRCLYTRRTDLAGNFRA